MTAILSRDELRKIAARHGLELLAVTDAAPLAEDRSRIEASVAAGRMGTMGWMGGTRAAIATEPAHHLEGARSVVVVAAPYDRSRSGWDPDPGALRRVLAPVLAGTPRKPTGRIARYALGSDYHASLRSRLQDVAADLRQRGATTGETAFVDDRPLAERALAARGGLGWIGKNTNLLTHSPAGSWVFLGDRKSVV